MTTAYLALRVRGNARVRTTVEDTLAMLRLHKVNHAVVVPSDATHEGMLTKTRDFITYGEVEPETLAKLVAARLYLLGDEKVTDAYVKEHTSFGSIGEFATAVAGGKARVTDLPRVKPVFRLDPPRRGYGGTKRHVADGGALGYRGKDINALVQRMLGGA